LEFSITQIQAKKCRSAKPSLNDKIMGTLPNFHSFGLTVCTLMPQLEGIPVIYHPDPTDGYGIGKLVTEHKATILLGTATFFRLYRAGSFK
jgi:acyl-[acyl-carrier-protein]-phospholipid O-acyltransferase/long-chain-fatty-acid--[acyl-carrier-protein] ligase